MGTFRVRTAAEQVGEYLRAELCRRAWGGRMPGGSRLAAELGVGRDTVEAALQILERDAERLAGLRSLARARYGSGSARNLPGHHCICHQ